MRTWAALSTVMPIGAPAAELAAEVASFAGSEASEGSGLEGRPDA